MSNLPTYHLFTYIKPTYLPTYLPFTYILFIYLPTYYLPTYENNNMIYI